MPRKFLLCLQPTLQGPAVVTGYGPWTSTRIPSISTHAPLLVTGRRTRRQKSASGVWRLACGLQQRRTEARSGSVSTGPVKSSASGVHLAQSRVEWDARSEERFWTRRDMMKMKMRATPQALSHSLALPFRLRSFARLSQRVRESRALPSFEPPCCSART